MQPQEKREAQTPGQKWQHHEPRENAAIPRAAVYRYHGGNVSGALASSQVVRAVGLAERGLAAETFCLDFRRTARSCLARECQDGFPRLKSPVQW